jgi:hypothetical protein
MRKTSISGQNLVEIAVIFAVVVGIFTLMQIYIQRSFNAKYKAGADYVHNELAKAAPAMAGLPRQYDPYYMNSTAQNIKVYNLTAGYPFNSVDQTDGQRAWVLTEVPGPKD